MKRVTFSIPWPLTASETREIFAFGFQIALVTYLALYLIELLRTGYVSLYYRLDTFLWIVIIMALLSGVWPAITPDSRKVRDLSFRKDLIWIGLLSIGTATVFWFKLVSLGWLVKIVAPLCGFIVLVLSLWVYYDRDDTS